MKPRKRLAGTLADWHPHPKDANNSLVPVVRSTSVADDVADRFFDSTPHGYTPDVPPAVETEGARPPGEQEALRKRRRYLMRYVAATVSLAGLIGLGAVVRVTTMRSAGATDAFSPSGYTSQAAQTPSEPLPPAVPSAESPAAAGDTPATAVVAEVPAAAPVPVPVPVPTNEPPPAAALNAPTVTDPGGPPSAQVEPSDSNPSDGPSGTPARARHARSADAAALTTPGGTNDLDATASKQASQRALDRGHLKASIAAGERAVSLDPTDADAWLILGAAYQSRGSYSAARRCFTSCSHLAKRGARSECRALLR